MIYVLDASGQFLYAQETPVGAEHWTAVALPQPCWNPHFSGTRQATGEWLGQWLHDGEPAPTAGQLCAKIDSVADKTRQVVAGDPLRAVEHQRAAIEAQSFKDSGYPPGAVPRTVAAWAINGRTALEAADSILAKAAQYAEVVYLIREQRLLAKEQIKQKIAAGALDEARQIATQAIAQIQKVITDVGSADVNL